MDIEPIAGGERLAETHPVQTPLARGGRAVAMSYKFQRLRERLRHAIVSGELSGKLPGERALATQFQANAKTLSKALTDLAAEGLLERSIGRGTYVKGSAPQTSSTAPWLILCDPEDIDGGLVRALQAINPSSRVGSAIRTIRPSYLHQFKAVIDLATSTPEAILRDLSIRGMPVVAADRQARHYNGHAVLVDRHNAAFCLGRQLLQDGHSRLGVVEPRDSTLVSDALRQAIQRYAPGATVDSVIPSDAAALLDRSVSVLICDGIAIAEGVRRLLNLRNLAVPDEVSLAAVGCCAGAVPCSGYFVTAATVAENIASLLRDLQPHRSAVLWLSPVWQDSGTIAPIHCGDSAIHTIPHPLATFLAGASMLFG